MSDSACASPGGSDPGLGFGGFVALMAGLMAMNALGIDTMLPALPEIGRSLHVASENARQWIITIYFLGFGVAQIIWGPLADRYGRKPLVVVSLMLFSLFSFVIILVPSFTVMLCARFLQGIAASASRVLVVSIVRDCYSGRRMARVMSLSFIVFLCVPLFAPGIGSLIMAFGGSWRTIFLMLGIYGLIVGTIAGLRLRETLHPEYRRPVSFRGVSVAMGRVLSNRSAIGYTLASGIAFGGMVGFINSIQQIIADSFHEPRMFPLIFGTITGAMGVAAYLNQRFVERLGTRRISHAALLCYMVAGAAHLGVAGAGLETIASFVPLMALLLFFQGLMGSNFNSMAMESVGDIAGTAASVQGFVSTNLAAVIGMTIGQAFNGTTVPLSAGFMGVGVGLLVVVLLAERGRLFRPQHPAPIR